MYSIMRTMDNNLGPPVTQQSPAYDTDPVINNKIV